MYRNKAAQPQHVLILGEPLIQYKQVGDQVPEQVGTAGDSYNYAITRAALQEQYGSNAHLYFGAALGESDQTTIKNLQVAGVNTDAFTTTDAQHDTARYTLHYNEDGTPRDGQDRNSYERDDAASRYYFTQTALPNLINKLDANGITHIVASHIMMGNSEDRESYLEFLRAAKERNIEISYADNYRETVWDSPEQAATYAKEALKLADIAFVSFDDEQQMHGDKNPEETATRLHSYGVKTAFITDGKEPILVSTKNNIGEIQQESVVTRTLEQKDIVSYAGAGDNFTAGCDYARNKAAHNKRPNAINHLAQSAAFGSFVAGEVLQNERDNLTAADLPAITALPKAHKALLDNHMMHNATAAER